MKFPVLEPLRRNGVRHRVGDSVEMDPSEDMAEIMRLVVAGVIRDVRPTAPEGAGNAGQEGDRSNGQSGQGDASGVAAPDQGNQVDGAGTGEQPASDAGESVAAAADGDQQAAGEQPGTPADTPAASAPEAPAPATKAPAKSARKVSAK